MTPAEELLAAVKEHATAEVPFGFDGGAYPMLHIEATEPSCSVLPGAGLKTYTPSPVAWLDRPTPTTPHRPPSTPLF